MSEERINKIEIKLAYMEDFINQIQQVCVENSKTIETLRAENRLMAQKIKDMSEQMEGDIPNRRPPHY
ncbi:MAG: SlyX family protein [Treponema sp.]|nr:SlyX family protein [Treponema sp.]